MSAERIRLDGGLLVALVFSLCLSARAASDSEDKPSVASQDITIHGKGADGSSVAAPPPISGKPVADEVIHSLRLYKTNYKVSGTLVRIPGIQDRLAKPFPQPPYLAFWPKAFPRPYDRWAFEVMSDNAVVSRIQGKGRIADDSSEDEDEDPVRIGGKHKKPEAKLTWDGTDTYGSFIAKIGPQYSFRFTGFKGEEEYSVTSEPIQLTSLTVPEGLNGMRLEVAMSTLYAEGEASFQRAAKPYLLEIAERLRRVNMKDETYKFSLYIKDPKSKLGMDRAEALADYFSKALVISPSKISIDILSAKDRGEVMSCLVPVIPVDSPIKKR